jgi:hypothetical protein
MRLTLLALVSASKRCRRAEQRLLTDGCHAYQLSTLAPRRSATRERLGFGMGCNLRRAAAVKDEGGTD